MEEEGDMEEIGEAREKLLESLRVWGMAWIAEDIESTIESTRKGRMGDKRRGGSKTRGVDDDKLPYDLDNPEKLMIAIRTTLWYVRVPYIMWQESRQILGDTLEAEERGERVKLGAKNVKFVVEGGDGVRKFEPFPEDFHEHANKLIGTLLKVAKKFDLPGRDDLERSTERLTEIERRDR